MSNKVREKERELSKLEALVERIKDQVDWLNEDAKEDVPLCEGGGGGGGGGGGSGNHVAMASTHLSTSYSAHIGVLNI